MKNIIFFLGSPGSGKGTQAKLMSKEYNYHHVSTGDLIRAIIVDPEAKEDDKKIVEEASLAGRLVPDDFICDLVFRTIDKFLESKDKGIIFDGAIRTVNQAEKIFDYLKSKNLDNSSLVVAILISDSEAYDRLTKRRVCLSCGEIVPWLPATKDLTSCPKCHGELRPRSDDKPEIIKNRIIDQGSSALNPLLDYFRKLGVLKEINGEQQIENVAEDVKKALAD